MSRSRLQQVLLPCRFDEAGEPLCFGAAGAPSEGSDAEESWPAARCPRVCRGLDLDDHLQIDQAGEVAVEHGRPQAHAAAGSFEHLVHDAKAVQIAIGEGEEDLKPVRFERGRVAAAFAKASFISIDIYHDQPSMDEPFCGILRSTLSRGRSLRMVLWQTASVVFFAYVILVVMIRSPTAEGRRADCGRCGLAGLLIVAASAIARPAAWF